MLILLLWGPHFEIDPINTSKTESSSHLIYGGLGNLYQQEKKDALKGKKTRTDFTPRFHRVEP